MSSQKKHDVFISYSVKDSRIASKIYHVLEKNSLKCWFAPRNVSSAARYSEEIDDAIASTKMVLLVYSEYSRKSQLVNHEINLAFSKNKEILSFNIDNPPHPENMQDFPKTTQWLSAGISPENEFETLVADALRLCGEKLSGPAVIDMYNCRYDNLSELKKDYMSLILLLTPLFSGSFIYMGIVSAKKSWILMGIIYSVPVLAGFLIFLKTGNMVFNAYPGTILLILIFAIFWIGVIIHGLIVRNEFLTRKLVLRFASPDEEIFEYLFDEYFQFNA